MEPALHAPRPTGIPQPPDVGTAQLNRAVPTDLYSQIARGAQTMGTAAVPARVATPPMRSPDVTSRHDPVLVAEAIQATTGAPAVRPGAAELKSATAAGGGTAPPTSIRQDFKERADTLRTAANATRREKWMGRAKNALFYALVVLVLSGVLLLLVRPSFVYAKEDEWSGPILTLWRVIGVSLLVAAAVFGYVLFMGS